MAGRPPLPTLPPLPALPHPLVLRNGRWMLLVGGPLQHELLPSEQLFSDAAMEAWRDNARWANDRAEVPLLATRPAGR